MIENKCYVLCQPILVIWPVGWNFYVIYYWVKMWDFVFDYWIKTWFIACDLGCHYEISKNRLESTSALTLVSTLVLMSASMSLLAQRPHQHPCQCNDEVAIQSVTFIFRHRKWAWAGLIRPQALPWRFKIITYSVIPWRFLVNRHGSQSMTISETVTNAV
jgi:hypothetical protein